MLIHASIIGLIRMLQYICIYTQTNRISIVTSQCGTAGNIAKTKKRSSVRSNVIRFGAVNFYHFVAKTSCHWEEQNERRRWWRETRDERKKKTQSDWMSVPRVGWVTNSQRPMVMTITSIASNGWTIHSHPKTIHWFRSINTNIFVNESKRDIVY